MLKVSNSFGFYSILTNPVLGYESLAKILVDEQVPFIQLRIKDQPKKKILKIAKNISAICYGKRSKFIINDDPMMVLECGADGVHLGQDDMPYVDAREMLGNDKIIGLSTHNPKQVKSANILKPDYIGVGPVYATPTKQNPDPVLGIKSLKEMINLSSLPIVAIGGIDFTNILDVKKMGILNVCAVRLINQCNNPKEVLDRLRTFYTW